MRINWPLFLFVLLTGCEKTVITTHCIKDVVDSQEAKSIRNSIHAQAKSNHKPLSYRQLWDALKAIDGEADSVRLIYSNSLRSKNLNGGEKGDWNREHVWARSYGINNKGADYTDLHNIFPCDMQTNSRQVISFLMMKLTRTLGSPQKV